MTSFNSFNLNINGLQLTNFQQFRGALRLNLLEEAGEKESLRQFAGDVAGPDPEELRPTGKLLLESYDDIDKNNDGILSEAEIKKVAKEDGDVTTLTAADFLSFQNKIAISRLPYQNVKLSVGKDGIKISQQGKEPIRFGEGVNRQQLETLLTNPSSLETIKSYLPFLKRLQESFDILDRNADGKIDRNELKLLAAASGGTGNRIITATDFKRIRRS